MDRASPAQMRLSDYAPPAFAIDEVDIEFDLAAVETRVRSSMLVRRLPGAEASAPLRLDGENLHLLGIAVDGKELPNSCYTVDGSGLTLKRPSAGTFRLDVETLISPAGNKSGRGMFEIGGKIATQCEAQGFRRITYFPDRPDVLSVYRVRLIADRAAFPVLLSNGDLTGRGDFEGGRHWAEWYDPHPKPSYIFAVVAGDFAVLPGRYLTGGGREVTLGIYADRDLIGNCSFAMAALKRSLAWDEETFGLEYDLDTYNVVALSGWAGAMENKGLNLFDAHGIVTDPEISTDDDYILIERIIGHEQFHNWTGNRVTCRDWFQLSLKEGLTRYRDQLFMEDKLGSGAWRIEMVKALRRNQFPEDDGPSAHPVKPDAYASIDNFYTGTVYEKGAELIRMLATLLGWEKFRKGFDLYISRNDGKAVTTEEFLEAMEEVSDRDLSQFRRWYSQAGRPRIEVKGTYNPEAATYELTLRQSCAPTPGQDEKQAFHIPVRVGLISSDGKPLSFSIAGKAAASETVLELTEDEQTFRFDHVAREPLPSMMRGFSAPVTVLPFLDYEELATLMAFDSDPYARWDAAQSLGIGLIRELAVQHAGHMSVPPSVIDAFARALQDDKADFFFRSQLLALPDEPILSEGLDEIDLDGHHRARRFVRQRLAEVLKPELLRTYEALTDRRPYSTDFDAVGRRKLRNACLELLMALETTDVLDLCLAQLKQGGNMTDMFEALCYLAHIDCPQRKEALNLFYDRWKDHPLVIDKWFNAQALSRMPGAVDEIIALESHPAFDLSNTSRGMHFYGGFFRQNRISFHDPSGKGYEFLADRLILIDRMGRPGSFWIMPQINQWRRYDPHRRSLMKKALQRVADEPDIGAGLREMVVAALAGGAE